MKRIVVGILAHVDSGKTTLSEGMLYRAGEIRKLGRVDHGDAFLDSHTLERERGITIFSKQALIRLRNSTVTLLDTPGHVDFSAEMERTLQVLDYAILVISGTDGVQSHTETLWNLLKRYRIPTFLFLNKMDLAGADRQSLMLELKQRLDENCVDFLAEDAEEAVATCGESLMESYLEQDFLEDARIAEAIKRREVFPCFFGSALKLEGVDTFLDGLERYTEEPKREKEFGAKVFKIAWDDQGNRLTYLKITGGVLKVKESLSGFSREKELWVEKVNQIRLYSGAKYQPVPQAVQGEVCAVTGLTKTYPGQGIGRETASAVPALEPVMTYRLELPEGTNLPDALSKLRLMEEEDPQLHVEWNERLQEIHLQLMGEVQMEILKTVIFQRFGLQVSFGQGNIVYKETITGPVEGVGHFEPLRHYAEVHLLMEPGERGSGLQFSVSCREDELDKNWQRLILTHLEEKVHVGVLTGSPITDMKITLAAGRAHLKHTEGGDFRQATYRAVRQGLKSAESILLEPVYEFTMELPPDAVGRAITDIQRMGGSFLPPENTASDMAVLRGTAPVSEMMGYQAELTRYTRGRGRLSCSLKGYEPCHNAEEVIAAIGYNSDSDLENPCDSVFCAHGSGFIVKWDQVKDYMHLESVLKEKPPEEELPDEVTERAYAVAYRATLEDDKELLAIFERTYGPIRKDPRIGFGVRKNSGAKGQRTKVKLPPKGPEFLLVDGYNIIFAWEDLKALAAEDLDAARNKLMDILCNYAGFRRCQLILVFDAYRVRGNRGEVERYHNISVVYTKEAETADMYIEKVTHRLAKDHRVRVATSDGLEQLIILGHGALRISASAFRQEIDEAERAIREILQENADATKRQ